MSVREHEDELTARAVFFRAEIDGFIHRTGAKIIDVVRGDPDRLHDLIIWWGEATADWMDAWSAERDFVSRDRDGGESGVPAEDM